MKQKGLLNIALLFVMAFLLNYSGKSQILTYTIVETNQTTFFNNNGEISEPSKGDHFYGQDASYTGAMPNYTDNGDGTITDNNTGFM